MAGRGQPRGEPARLPRAPAQGSHTGAPGSSSMACDSGGRGVGAMLSTREACHTLSTRGLYWGPVTAAPCLARANTPTPEESGCPASMVACSRDEARGASLLSGAAGLLPLPP